MNSHVETRDSYSIYFILFHQSIFITNPIISPDTFYRLYSYPPFQSFIMNLDQALRDNDDDDEQQDQDQDRVDQGADEIAIAAQIQLLTDQLAALRAAHGQPPAESTVRTSTIIDNNATTFSELIGDFLATERTEIELEHSSMQVISRADRDRLNASDKNKIYQAFIKGIPSKFKATSTVVGLDDVSTIDNIISFAQLRLELQKHITSVSAHSVFLILNFDPTTNQLINPDSQSGKPVNLLSTNVLPPIAQVEQSTLFHYRRGSSFNQQNLTWTFEAIRNSCDKDLQSILDAKMLKYKVSERFGPMLYYELVLQMTNVDSKAVRSITRELSCLKITDHDGQSIAKVAKIIRSTIIWLEMVQMLPPDIDAMVVDILETCTVPDFQLFFKTLCANASLNNMQLSVESMLARAEEHYRFLILAKRWDAVGHQGSSFNANPSNLQRSGATTTSNNRRSRVPPPPWHRTAPLAGESHEKTFEERVYKWCGVCDRWFYGDRGHLTNEHVPGYTTTNRRNSNSNSTPSAATNLGSNDTTTPDATMTPSGPSLSRTYFTGGL